MLDIFPANDDGHDFSKGWGAMEKRPLGLFDINPKGCLVSNQVRRGCEKCALILSLGGCTYDPEIDTSVPRICRNMIPAGTFQHRNF